MRKTLLQREKEQYKLINFFTNAIKHLSIKNKKYDIIIANILSVTLAKLSKTFQKLTKRKIILSGILNSQTESVINAYKPWVDLIEIEKSEDWVLLYGEL